MSTPSKNVDAKPGAKPGNKSAYRHGLRSNQTSDAVVNNQLRAFRRSIREEIAGPDGRLTVAQEALIQSLVRWETRCLLAGHYLRREPKLRIERRMELLATITAATAERDKVLKQLGIVGSINGKTAGSDSLWDALDGETPTSPANEPGGVPPAAEPSDSLKAPPTGSQSNSGRDDPPPNPANGEYPRVSNERPPAATSPENPTAKLCSGRGDASQNRTRETESDGLATKAGKPA